MFKKAIRQHAYLRLALMGPAGSGKTYTALLLAKHMGAKKIAVIDSERGSAKLYSNLCDFDVCELESFAVERYMDAIAFAQREGYDFLVIDSLSHAWAGKDGILEYKDKRTEASKSRDSFGAGWRDASPLHTKFVDSILAFKGHVIATLRTKTEYVIEEGANGKKTPRKIGMAPVQREGVEYEFTVVGDFIDHNKLAITKTRIDALNDAVIVRPGREMAETIMAWLNSAEPEPMAPKAPAVAPVPPAAQHRTAQQVCAAIVTQIREAAGQSYEGTLRAEVTNLLNDTDPAKLDTETIKALLGTQAAPGPLRALRDRVLAGQWLAPSAAPPAPEKPPATVYPISPACEELLATIRTSLDVIVHDFPGFAEQARKIVNERPIESMPEAGLRAVKLALDAVYAQA